MNDLFQLATRKKYRFETTRGQLTTEQLWDLPLADLNTTAKSISRHIRESQQEESFIPGENSVADDSFANKLEIVKTIITVKHAESVAVQKEHERKVKKQNLLAALHKKENEQLNELTVEELRKQIEALD